MRDDGRLWDDPLSREELHGAHFSREPLDGDGAQTGKASASKTVVQPQTAQALSEKAQRARMATQAGLATRPLTARRSPRPSRFAGASEPGMPLWQRVAAGVGVVALVAALGAGAFVLTEAGKSVPIPDIFRPEQSAPEADGQEAADAGTDGAVAADGTAAGTASDQAGVVGADNEVSASEVFGENGAGASGAGAGEAGTQDAAGSGSAGADSSDSQGGSGSGSQGGSESTDPGAGGDSGSDPDSDDAITEGGTWTRYY